MNKTFIIAEAGVNHNGSIDLAKRLIDKAVWVGVDAVKFQTFTADKLVTKTAKKADYQNKTTTEKNQYEMLKKLELKTKDFQILKDYCDQKGIKFMSSPFDLDSIDLLKEIGLDIWKIPSGEITNYPYLKKIAELKQNIIMSTGMANLSEIESALNLLKENGAEDITVLHCNTEYPTPMEDVNLKAMLTIKEAFKVDVGYSDHTKGIEIPTAAVALGAKVIEKHFTLDNSMEGPDHRASLEPKELKHMVDAIRNVENALGDGIKKPSESESKNKDISRKSIVAAKEIKQGEIFSKNNLTIKRPGNGINPMQWPNILGKKAKREFTFDELIEL
ncbi:N-acetylneuraminate synthase [Halanaerobium congolense]|jgi:N,N'-diacetyllegionaminate synthase|uniref:N-acetylneuraminate synthase n=1 Tax=Halanaerobium congolense TaxID=54121 RepID=A0A1H9ZQ57_9FIRM|nr:N-acetylneuraminate synthase [Halanaerobium congolense]PTX16337.1 N-acetylneuraminate synthase [Halanaerobium congolense]SDF15161.1 N-acetylneuraminate synthase [Halanaerobium congolense]SES83911.1 N-acetylneuraminate synthase [Halanaerobium congolense]SFP44686.1 N-acetylneuraminate synthase [Halanaerobium congolense]